MLKLMRKVSVRDYRAAPGRLALMIGGIASGVALIAALGIINESVVANFRLMLERAAGKAALQIALGTGEVGFDEKTIDVVLADPEVKAAYGFVRGTLAAGDGSGEALQLYGIDLVSDAADSYDIEVTDREGDDVEILNDQTSIFVTEEYAAERHLTLGSVVPFAAPTGVRQLRIRGLLRPDGLARVFGGALVIMDTAAAQRLLGKKGLVDQIDVVLKDDRRAHVVQERLRRRLPASLTVAVPALRGARFERLIGAFQSMLDSLSLLCLLAGVFIVYNASATAITQRARDLAILMALGGERRRIFTLVVAEAAVLGFVASGMGIGLGFGLAKVLLTFVAQSMGVIYQARFSVESLTLTAGQVVRYVATGVVGSVAAALVPARKASRLDPLELMRPDFRERLAIGSANRALLAVFVVLIALTIGAAIVAEARRSVAWSNLGSVLASISVVVVAIPLMAGVIQLFRPILPRAFGLDGRIAVESLVRSPGRTGVTTAVIALTLGLAVTVSSVAKSFRESERNWFILAGDLVVSAVSTEGGWLETPLSASVADTLLRVPGVARVETYRVLPGQAFEDTRIAVVAVSPGFIETDAFRRRIVEGDPASAVEAIADQDGVVVSDNLADRFHLRVGSKIELPTPAGNRAFVVRGVVSGDYSGDRGAVILHRDEFAALWYDRRVSHFNVFVRPDADVNAVRREIVRTIGKEHLVKVLTVAQTLAYHQQMVDRAFAFTYAIQLLVVAVTLAGIFDLLTTQVIERRREIGIFRALGADEIRIVRAIRLEAVLIGVVGAVMGACLGVGTSLLWLEVNFKVLVGYILEHHFALATACWCVALAASVAMASGQLAARRALRQPVLDTLRYE